MYTSLSLLAVVVVMAILRLFLVMPHIQSFEL